MVNKYELNELFQISKQSSRKWPLKAWKGGHQKLEPFYSQRKLPSFQIITPPVDLTLPFPKDFSSKIFALNLFHTLQHWKYILFMVKSKYQEINLLWCLFCCDGKGWEGVIMIYAGANRKISGKWNIRDITYIFHYQLYNNKLKQSLRSLQSQNQDICFVVVDQLAPGVTLYGTQPSVCTSREKQFQCSLTLGDVFGEREIKSLKETVNRRMIWLCLSMRTPNQSIMRK